MPQLKPRSSRMFAISARFTALHSLDLALCYLDFPKASVVKAALAKLKPLASLANLRITTVRGLTDQPPLGELTQLLRLDLTACERLQQLHQVARLTNLRELNLKFCTSLTGSALASLSALTHLRNLILTGFCDLDAAGCEALAHLSALTRLDLDSVKRVDSAALGDALRRMTALQDLGMEHLPRAPSADVLPAIAALPHLERLNLHDCGCMAHAHELLAPLASAGALRELRLGFCDFICADELLASLGNQPTLEHLEVPGAHVSAAGLRSIARWTSLTHLDLSCTPDFADRDLKLLAPLTGLRTLFLVRNRFVTPAVATVLTCLASLEELGMACYPPAVLDAVQRMLPHVSLVSCAKYGMT